MFGVDSYGVKKYQAKNQGQVIEENNRAVILCDFPHMS